MNILKYERKLHVYIKYIFHLIFFVVGFIAGFTLNKASASTYTYSYTNYPQLRYNSNFQKPTSSNYNDYNTINSLFNYINTQLNLNFDYTNIEDFVSLFKTSHNSGTDYNAQYFFSNYLSGNNWITYPTSIFNFYVAPNYRGNFLYLDFNSVGVNVTYYTNTVGDGYGPVIFHNISDYYKLSANTPFPAISRQYYDKKLNFHKFYDTLFDSNQNFKQVCVNKNDTFSITAKGVQSIDPSTNSPFYHNYDFIWFKNKVTGLSTYRYNSAVIDKVQIFDEDPNSFNGWWYYLNDAEEITKFFDRTNPGAFLTMKNYPYLDINNRNGYFNYTFYPFEMAFSNSSYFYPIFWFRDLKIETPTDHYSPITSDYLSTSYICFYINKEYDVNILKHNSFGDVYGTVEVLDGVILDDQTHKNEFSVSTPSGSITNIDNFITYIRNTIIFINQNITSLYLALPTPIRMFILFALTIFVIILILRLVIK
ncbi:MAG: hypothetical protein Q4E75_00690 [bacterium]|nr:hypothetical protein [bacterium]